MDSILRKGLFLVTLTGAIGVFPATAYASDIEDNHTMPGVGIEQVLNDCYSSQKEIQVEDYLAPEDKGEYLDMAFADVESFLYIRSEPTKQSEWVGKLYPGYAAKIVGPVGEWTKIESGSVTGYNNRKKCSAEGRGSRRSFCKRRFQRSFFLCRI